MYKVVFVVLHYKTKLDTFRCVDSILKNIIYKNKEIVIVDNGSCDGSGDELREKYESADCHVIISKKNKGFARGNNLGFKYAKNTLGADFIILLNNDTFIEQLEFVDIMIQKYNETNFYVCGPDVIDHMFGQHLNPQRQYNTTFFGMAHFRRDCVKKIICTYSPKFKLDNSGDSKNKEIKTFVAEDVEGCMLHGSCLIFSPLYIEKYNGLYAGTFMYLEEDILKLQMDTLGHKMLYAHELKVNHLGQSATKFVFPDYKKRIRKRHMELVKSSLHYNWIIIKMKFSIPFFLQWIKKRII